MRSVGTLGHALLGLLAGREMSGYELTRAFDKSLANVWSARHSQIYPELAKLEAAGLIRRTASGSRGSKSYAATEAGVAEVRRWLAESLPPEVLRSESLLRVFFLWLLPTDEVETYLRAQEARHRERLVDYRALAERIRSTDDGPLRWGRIALEAGIRYEEAMAEWARWAREELDGDERR
jgi:DNA-binding PadR family transcriptional regulator